jgi:hypothetical protein
LGENKTWKKKKKKKKMITVTTVVHILSFYNNTTAYIDIFVFFGFSYSLLSATVREVK